MKALTKYQIRKISKNLDKYFNLATDQDIKQGKQWYKDANEICQDIAGRYNTDTMTAAQVISALSPRNKWKQNILDAYTIFDAVQDGKNPEDVKVCTFHTNKFKAFNIAKSKTRITDKSLKTYNFCKNIANLCAESLTIDIWHLRGCMDKLIKIDNASIGRLAYGQIKKLTIKKAEKLGLKGYELQAIIWLTTQKNYGI